MPRKRKAIAQREAKPGRTGAEGKEELVDLWGSEPASLEHEDFEDEARAIAAKQRTAFGYVRPGKRRYLHPCQILAVHFADQLASPGC